MIVILDASAVIELILKRNHSEQIEEIISNCSKVITTDLYKAEITNVFWKYVKADLLCKTDAVTFLNFGIDIIDEYFDIAPYSIEALNEALRLKHSTYDMLYLTLAKRTGGILLTLDKKLSCIAKNEGIETPVLVDNT